MRISHEKQGIISYRYQLKKNYCASLVYLETYIC